MDEVSRLLDHYRKTGEKIWFEKIYYYFMPKIYNYFYFKTLDKHSSEDLTSDVFLKVYKSLQEKRFNSRSFSVWIYKISHNILIDFIRKTSKENKSSFLVDWQESEEIQDKNLIESDFLIKNSEFLRKEFAFGDIRLIEAMLKLTQLQRDVLLLIFVMDFDYATVARMLLKQQSTIRGIVFRAINILKNEIISEQ